MKQSEPKPVVCRGIDGLVVGIGKAVAWLNVALVLVILIQVIMRYGFGQGMVRLEELQWHLYAVLIMIGLSYDVVVDGHIRLDVLHRRFSPKAKEWVDVLGTIFLLLPMVVVLFVHGLDFVATSIRINEASDSPLGLPYRWIIKSFVPISMFLLGLAAISRVIRGLSNIFRKSQG
jgi:TRAP-type mannitol/chloroaromatic compound transport system permease small subunit